MEVQNPIIVCAAVKIRDTGEVFCGPRHGDCINQMLRLGFEGKANETDCQMGFVDQHGGFHTREEAWVIADKNGQIRRPFGFETHYGNCRPANVGDSGLLFSENLY